MTGIHVAVAKWQVRNSGRNPMASVQPTLAASISWPRISADAIGPVLAAELAKGRWLKAILHCSYARQVCLAQVWFWVGEGGRNWVCQEVCQPGKGSGDGLHPLGCIQAPAPPDRPSWFGLRSLLGTAPTKQQAQVWVSPSGWLELPRAKGMNEHWPRETPASS